MPGYYNIPTTTKAVGDSLFPIIWLVLTFIIAVIGAFLIYFLFVKSKNEPNGKLAKWLKDFLDFKKLTIEVVLKVLYYFMAIFITVGSIADFGKVGALGLITIPLTIIFGNLILRLFFESILMFVGIWSNTNEINKKLK